MTGSYLSSWSFLYLGSAMISLVVSLDVIAKNRYSPQHRQFFVYGLLSTCYLLVVFSVLNAPTQDLAMDLFRFSNILYFLSIGMLAYFVYNLLDTGSKGWLVFIPPVVAASAVFYIPYQAQLTSFGWTVSSRPEISVGGVVAFLYLLGYMMFVGIHLYDGMKKSKVPWLYNKYGLMLIGFVLFQILGVFAFNALITVNRDLPHVAGIFYFLAFVSMWYGFRMERPKEVRATKAGIQLSDSYQMFINKFLQVAPADELGLKTMDLLEYLDKTRLSDVVTYDRLRIILNAEKIGQIDNIQALDRTMEYLEGKGWSDMLASTFLLVLESVSDTIESSQRDPDLFKAILLKHQDFLKATDIIYGLAEARFLQSVSPDNSLQNEPEWRAVLRMYRRLLLPIRRFLTGPIAADFLRKIRSMDVTKHADMTDDGQIEIERISGYLQGLPEQRRTEALTNAFTILLSWISQEMIARDPIYFREYMRVSRRIVRLNERTKGVMRMYVSLANRLIADLGRGQIIDLILSEGYGPEDLDAFSATLGLTHDKIQSENVLVEYDPRLPYEFHVRRLFREVDANFDRCVLFTRGGSKIQRIAESSENIEVRILATPGIQQEGSLPFNDITQLIHAVGKALDSEFRTWIVFDSLSDLMLSVGFEQAYVFARHTTDIIASKKGPSVFLLNKRAHSQETRASFEGLFSSIIEIDEKPKLVKK